VKVELPTSRVFFSEAQLRKREKPKIPSAEREQEGTRPSRMGPPPESEMRSEGLLRKSSVKATNMVHILTTNSLFNYVFFYPASFSGAF